MSAIASKSGFARRSGAAEDSRDAGEFTYVTVLGHMKTMALIIVSFHSVCLHCHFITMLQVEMVLLQNSLTSWALFLIEVLGLL